MRLPSIRRPSPSMAVSVMALVVASTGTSYAAGLIGSDDIRNNSIQSKDVKDRTLKGRDIKNDVIGSNKIRNGSLKARDFKEGQLPAGAQGPAGVGRWALVDASGAIVAQSGGFSVTAAYPTLAPMGADAAGLRANGNVYINAGENLSNNGVLAVVALQNTVDQNGDTSPTAVPRAPTPTRSSPARSPPRCASPTSSTARLPAPATPTTSWSARATATAPSPPTAPASGSTSWSPGTPPTAAEAYVGQVAR